MKQKLKLFWSKYWFIVTVLLIILIFSRVKILVGIGKSMLPTFSEFQINLCVKQRTYEVGDIVSYRVGNYPIAHRIVDIKEVEIDGIRVKLYTLKGDNNDVVDPYVVYDENIECKIVH